MNRIQAAQKCCEILDEAGFTTSLWTKESLWTDSPNHVAVGVHVRVYVAKTKLDGRKGDDLGYVQITDRVDLSRLNTNKGQLFSLKNTLAEIPVTELEMAPAGRVLKSEVNGLEKERVEATLEFGGVPYPTDEIEQLKQQALDLSFEAQKQNISKEDYLPFVTAIIRWLEACEKRSEDREDWLGLATIKDQLEKYRADETRLQVKQ